jgi:hypothetical protein
MLVTVGDPRCWTNLQWFDADSSSLIFWTCNRNSFCPRGSFCISYSFWFDSQQIGADRFEATLPSIIENCVHENPLVREGYLQLLVFLPRAVQDDYVRFIDQLHPCIFGGLADKEETVRSVALHAAKVQWLWTWTDVLNQMVRWKGAVCDYEYGEGGTPITFNSVWSVWGRRGEGGGTVHGQNTPTGCCRKAWTGFQYLLNAHWIRSKPLWYTLTDIKWVFGEIQWVFNGICGRFNTDWMFHFSQK